ncbi:MAG: hypothetical protein C3F13_14335 [Anaerolineales bacterium]|nr:MAG: hypothetical protein C3F13_14335 [Anaerolineales bacterium]
MVDVRPLCVDVPLEVVFAQKSQSAGMVDLSPDIGRDIAADKALATAFATQLFLETSLEFFDFSFYWHSVEEMKADLDENWKDETKISEDVWQSADELLAEHSPGAKLRLAVQMKLGLYKKLIILSND